MKTTLIILALLCAGCAKQAETTASANASFEVDTLFTKDGCTVYRFFDAAHYRYFTNCSGSTSYETVYGKFTRPEGVNGGGRP